MKNLKIDGHKNKISIKSPLCEKTLTKYVAINRYFKRYIQTVNISDFPFTDILQLLFIFRKDFQSDGLSRNSIIGTEPHSENYNLLSNHRINSNDFQGPLRFMVFLLHSQLQSTQESIPVGCAPTAAVAATRCHYQRGLPNPLEDPFPHPPWIEWLTDTSENITFTCGR